MTCPYSAWTLLPLELRRHLRGLSGYAFNPQRQAHLAANVRCRVCRVETETAA